MSNPKKGADYIAIKLKDHSVYIWYDRSGMPITKPPPITGDERNRAETVLVPSGKFIERADGEVAEIWEPEKA